MSYNHLTESDGLKPRTRLPRWRPRRRGGRGLAGATAEALSARRAERASGDGRSRRFLRILAVKAKRRGWSPAASCVNRRGQPFLTGWPH